MHRDALDDFARAKRLAREAGPAGSQAPAWAGLAEALCRFDAAPLREAARGTDQAQLAGLLHFLAVESKVTVRRTLEAADEALKENPECSRILDAIADVGGVSTQHRTTVTGMEVFARTFPKRLAELPGLPAPVSRLLEKQAPEPEVLAALVDAGRTTDAAEPSWAVLGRWAQDARFLQVCRRLMFMHDRWAVPVDEFLQAARPLVADHRLVAFVDSFGLDRRRQPAEVARLLAGLPLADLDLRADGIFRVLSQVDPRGWATVGRRVGAYEDFCYQDCALYLAWAPPGHKADKAGNTLSVSPHAPVGMAALIDDDWEHAKAHAAEWEKGCQHPEVLLALGRRYLQLKWTEDAERCLKRAVALSPERPAYRLLAQVYGDAGKTDQWLAALEEVLKGEDTGLDHAQVRVEIAQHFMRQKDFARARPYAEAAAESGAEWAMRCAADCSEGLGEWDQAEQWLRQVSERYDNAYGAWFLWCRRTGKGDAPAAQRLLEERVRALGARRAGDDLILIGTYHSLTGRPREALELFGEAARDPELVWGHLLLAALHDEAGDTAARDQALQAVAGNNPYKPVADFLRAALAKGEKAALDPDEADKLLRALAVPARPASCYVLGRFAERRGQAEAARDYYRRCVAEAEFKNSVIPVLAGARLSQR